MCSSPEQEPSKPESREGPRQGTALLSLPCTHKTIHIEMPVGKADKKFKQPQGTQVGGWVPETLGHRLIPPPPHQNTLQHFSSNFQTSLLIARLSSIAQSSRFSSICFVLNRFESFSLFIFL